MFRLAGCCTSSRGCRLPRRELLQVGSAAALGLSLPELLRAQQAGAADRDNQVSVILLFMWGGMPQQDMWDLKPQAPAEIRGELNPIATRVPGMQICELLPRLAANADLFTLVRSATHSETEHPRAAHFMMTGNQVIRGTEWPNMGATIARFAPGGGQLGSVVIGPRLIDAPITPTGQDGGFLGNVWSPFRIRDPLKPVEQFAALNPPPGLSPQRYQRRQRLYRTVTEFQRDVESDQAAMLDSAYQRAFSIVTSPQAKRAFDLSRESPKLRERYGEYAFGQGALMARRLVEAGVRFVQVNWREHPINDHGFDNHGDNFKKLRDPQCPQVDRTVSALLEDLRDRQMLDRTLVLVTGEFGRTPKINGSAGRDHWPFCFSYLLAGAGFSTGRVIGASDQFAAYPADAPVSPGTTVATVFGRVGLDLPALQRAGILEETHTLGG